MRKALAVSIKCAVAPETFPGMPVRVWNGSILECRIIAEAPNFPANPDAWVWHRSAKNIREGIQWFDNGWHLLTTFPFHVETCEIQPFSSDGCESQ